MFQFFLGLNYFPPSYAEMHFLLSMVTALYLLNMLGFLEMIVFVAEMIVVVRATEMCVSMQVIHDLRPKVQ